MLFFGVNQLLDLNSYFFEAIVFLENIFLSSVEF